MLISSHRTKPIMTDAGSPGGFDVRQHARRLYRATAQLIVVGSPPFTVRTVDISAGGMAILTTVQPPRGLNCTVLLSLPQTGREPVALELPVTVSHSIFSRGEEGVKVGLSFNGLAPDKVAVIQKFVDGEG